MPFWKKAKCPVDIETKRWIESRFKWLIDQYGLEHLWDVKVILPTPSYFPDRYDGSEHSIRSLLDRVCEHMAIDPDRISLRLYNESQHVEVVPGMHITSQEGGTAGLYEQDHKEIISLETSNLGDQMAVIATFAHELGHVHLLGDQRMTGEEEDHEQVTDLITVFLGMGIFNANCVIRDHQWSEGGWSGWSIGKQGYLDEPAFAWALALFAWMRNEKKPAWFKHLRLEVRGMAKQGLRYLENTGDTSIKRIVHRASN